MNNKYIIEHVIRGMLNTLDIVGGKIHLKIHLKIFLGEGGWGELGY